MLLRALRRIGPPDRDEVLIPAYTCYSVAASVIKAGLRPRLADVSPDTLDYDRAALEGADFRRVLAVVATSLYGLPSDTPEWARLAAGHGAFLIDDAAQAMGATLDGRWCGTCGDAGLFSFDKGKNVSAIDGGVVVTASDRIADALEQERQAMTPRTSGDSARHVVKALAYWAMLRPWLYRIPASIPQLGLGKTIFTTDFPVAVPDPVLIALAEVMLRRLDSFTAARRANAAQLLDGLAGVPGIHPVRPQPGSAPAYLRLPILFNGRSDRDRAIRALVSDGIGATGSYPASLADVPEVAAVAANAGLRAEGARHVADCILTLPTHPFVSRPGIERAVAALRNGALQPCAA
jgi:dTDP-4-amino-4,6-dideoxygalactose transaminase